MNEAIKKIGLLMTSGVVLAISAVAAVARISQAIDDHEIVFDVGGAEPGGLR